MSTIESLMLLLGSPLHISEGVFEEFSSRRKRELFNLAEKNKIGLFLLERLNEIDDVLPLEGEYREANDRYLETLKTAERISKVLNEHTDDFALFKFFKPYPHTPSDVDVLFFCDEGEYIELIDILLNEGYYKTNECPSQTVIYDKRGGMENITLRGKIGGRYYIDLYREVSASHFIYMDSSTLEPYKSNVTRDGRNFRTLSPEADMAVVLTHSIIPEQMFTLGDYYTCLYYADMMDRDRLEYVSYIFEKNNIRRAGFASLYLIADLHEKVHGFVPDKIEFLIDSMGGNLKRECFNDTFSLPHKYGIATLVKVLLERITNKNGLASMIAQLINSAYKPNLAKWAIYNLIFRRKRETY